MAVIIYGIFQFYYYKLKMKKDYIPFLTMLSITFIMFIAGLLNVMEETVMVIISFSILCYLWVYIKKHSQFNIRSNGMIFFGIAGVLLMFILRGNRVFAYDDFSHWTLVTREILINDRLPNFSNDMISFQAYPTGEAGFIYFFGKILGNTEGIMLFAKALFSISCLTPLFSLIKEKKVSSYLALSLFAILVLFSNYGLNSLYVDSLLTLITVGATAIILDSYLDNKLNDAILPLLLASSVLVMMKNSGLLFAMILIILFVGMKLKNKDFTNMPATLTAVASPFLVRKLWDSHTEFAFLDASGSKHSLSASGYQGIFGLKTPEDIEFITKELVSRSLNLNSYDRRVLLIVFAFLILAIIYKKYIAKSIDNKNEFKLLIITISLYVLYQMGLLFTYLFSMPIGEAVRLASYERYNLTMTLYILGLFIIYYLYNNNDKSTKMFSVFFTITIMLTLTISVYNRKEEIIKVASNRGYELSVRKEFHEITSGFKSNEDDHFIIYASDRKDVTTNGYLSYQTKYDLRSTNINILTIDNFERFSELIKNRNYTLIILEDDEVFSQYLAGFGYDSKEKIIDINMGESNE